MKKTPNLHRVIRLDNLALSSTFFTPEGYLRDRPILTSTGIFEYFNPDGSVRRELRLPEDVFDTESLKSYKGKPIIITHDAGLIDKGNVHSEQIGTILSEGYQSGNDVKAEIVIHDTDEMKDCGLKELSLGYNLDLDETPGTWNGQHYDAIQRNIRINHLALVREARAGEQARLNIDSRDNSNILKGGKKAMKSTKSSKKTKNADGVLTPEELAKAIEDYKAKKASRVAAKVDEEGAPKTEQVATSKPEDGEITAIDEDAPVEEKVEILKDRRDRRDEEGDPKTKDEAMGVIANQDEDISILFDIIDTLLAEKAFDEAEATLEEGKTAKTGDNLIDGENTDEDEIVEEDVVAEDEEEIEEEGPEIVAEDEDDLVEEESLDEDEVIEAPATEEKKLNADSVDRLVRQRVRLGMIGRTLNMDGLETMPLRKAQIAVIKAVNPGIRLDGKSSAYISAAFDCACNTVEKNSRKDTSYQKKQMFNKDSRSTKKLTGSDAARQRMIDRQQNKKEAK